MKREHKYYMRVAIEMARQALVEGEFPVGCVIVNDGKIVADGRRRNCKRDNGSELDHAEIIALRKFSEKQIKVDLAKVTIYSSMEPCLMCFSTLLVNGITRFVYGYEDIMGGGTNLPVKMLSPLYRSLDISITAGILRKESLELFQTFFSSPDCDYLKGTLLAEYTLQQKTSYTAS
ncbi:tRNA-specific adenosine deaminase [Desulfomarina profundi]|uniref:tRNA-specific adenosine deaminase n=1 Tax=Desulfomarina profundi TaxID=2772557 RepID=A0A8D5FG18_9BACT|nr:nucleoside deaminase [Desulfomarina profundi]BCL60987.1 tRNA-specific adenosine deaminase [Desulfomarina profundi]